MLLLSQMNLEPGEWIALGGITLAFVGWLTKISYDTGSIKKAVELTLKNHNHRIDGCEKKVTKNRESIVRIETRINEA